MPAEEKSLNDIASGVEELRKEFAKAAPDLAKIEIIETSLEKHEAANQELTKANAESKKREEEYKERIDALDVKAKDYYERVDDLEKELARGNNSIDKDYRDGDEYKAFHNYVVNGKSNLSSEQKALLRTDVDTAGGYLVSSEMDTTILKKIVEVSPIRSIARVRSIGSKSLEIPVRTGIPTATFEGEAEAASQSMSTYGSETLTTFRQTVVIPITEDLLMDARFNMEGEIMSDASDEFAQNEGAKFVNGSGFKQPSGFTTDSRTLADARISASVGEIGFDDVMLMTGDLKTGYNPTYVFNRRTLAFLRTLKGGDGHPVWLPGMNESVMSTINGFPYIIANDMSDIASGSISVAFGDFGRGYTIVDRTGLVVIRDDVTAADQAIVKFTLRRWLTGQVVLPEAIKLLQTKA